MSWIQSEPCTSRSSPEMVRCRGADAAEWTMCKLQSPALAPATSTASSKLVFKHNPPSRTILPSTMSGKVTVMGLFSRDVSPLDIQCAQTCTCGLNRCRTSCQKDKGPQAQSGLMHSVGCKVHLKAIMGRALAPGLHLSFTLCKAGDLGEGTVCLCDSWEGWVERKGYLGYALVKNEPRDPNM